jgi:hypothetical protein
MTTYKNYNLNTNLTRCIVTQNHQIRIASYTLRVVRFEIPVIVHIILYQVIMMRLK